jgi:predicted acylesterase/phospholipase RssA
MRFLLQSARGVVLLALVALAACTTALPRSPVPEAGATLAAPHGIDPPFGILREWGDVIDPATRAEIVRARAAQLRTKHADDIAAGRPITETALLLSGGGPDGAFGAGFLNGWTARGDRPEFDFVTGVSTGAIIALFAYLGPDYDDALTEIYTTYRTEQLVTRAILAGLTGGSAITDTRGYRALIERYIDDAVMERIAQEAEKGRILLIGTTNIDAARPVIWNVGGIARTRHPQARRLVHDIVQASSAIPAAFPPVIIPVVTPDGGRFDEMHVDGGATQQIIYFSPNVPMRDVDAELGVPIERRIYAIVNNKLRKPYTPVRPRLVSIAGASASSLIGGSSGGDLYRIFAIAERDGIALNITGIPVEFTAEAEEPFDPVYMKALYDLGFQKGLAGEGWLPHPPDFAPRTQTRRAAR